MKGGTGAYKHALGLGFSPREAVTLASLSTPALIQDFIERLRYNKEPRGDTVRSPREVLRRKEAHCIEAAMLAATCLRIHGQEPLIVDLEASHDLDHVICVFKEKGGWGALSKSRFHSLGYRDPIHRNIRELALTYFNMYNNYKGEKCLRNYSRPVNLRRFDKAKWWLSKEDVWLIPEYLCEISHTPLATKAQLRTLRHVSLSAQYGDMAFPSKGWRNRRPKHGA